MTYSNSLPIYHVAYTGCDQLHFLNIYDMLELVKKEELTKETHVWKKGMNQWVKAGKVPDLKPLFAMPPDVPIEVEKQLRWPDYGEF